MVEPALEITMLSRRFRYFPLRFAIPGKSPTEPLTEHAVTAVERCWTNQEQTAFFFRVRTQSQVFVLKQEIATNRWYMEPSHERKS